jgi:hypothetical protein
MNRLQKWLRYPLESTENFDRFVTWVLRFCYAVVFLALASAVGLVVTEVTMQKGHSLRRDKHPKQQDCADNEVRGASYVHLWRRPEAAADAFEGAPTVLHVLPHRTGLEPAVLRLYR